MSNDALRRQAERFLAFALKARESWKSLRASSSQEVDLSSSGVIVELVVM
jgi:hypothetical protein